jgi:nucleotide-binding universal stress UspA family protein
LEAIMKNILLLVHDDAGQEARLQAALDVTRAVEGHLRCVDVVQVPVVFGDPQDSAGTAMLMEDEFDREKHNSDVLKRRLAGEGVSWEWAEVIGDLSEAIVDAADLADLIVLNRKLDDVSAPDMRGITGAILGQTHKPVVAVPESLKQFDLGGRALIAWDGSKAVSATMSAVIPLLKLASQVYLFCVEKTGTETDLSEAALYLSRHGIHADLKRAYDPQHDVAKVIDNECERWGARWCLMGAYGHSRLREALFGGVTRQMLTNSNIPVVLGH